MKTNNDESILAGFKQGDEKAVKQIFERYHKELVVTMKTIQSIFKKIVRPGNSGP
jgi:hypothetical protein